MKNMRILIVEPEQAPEVADITGSLPEMQQIVGGLIQAVYPFPERVALICNEDGKMLGLPRNRGLRDEVGNLYDIICGTFFLCGVPPDSDNFASLTPEQIAQFQERFQLPEAFLNVNGRILCLPLVSQNE